MERIILQIMTQNAFQLYWGTEQDLLWKIFTDRSHSLDIYTA